MPQLQYTGRGIMLLISMLQYSLLCTYSDPHLQWSSSSISPELQVVPTKSTLPNTLLTYSMAFLWKTSLFDLYHKLIDTEPFTMDLMDYTHLSTPIDNITSEQALLDLHHSIFLRQREIDDTKLF